MAASNEDSEKTKPLKVSEKLFYGIGDISNGLAVSSMSVWYLYYLTDVAGLGAAMAGIAVTIGRLWDAVTDPLMGWITDHTKSRWGKRLPYLLFGAIPYALAYFSLWVVPEFESSWATFFYVTISLLLFNTCLTVVFVPYTSLTAAITNDYDERTSITGFRMVCSQVAFLIGAAVPPAIVHWSVKTRGDGNLDAYFGSWAQTAREGHLIAAALFAIIMVASIWTTFKGTTERCFETANTEDKPKHTPLSYAGAIIRALKSNKPFAISVSILLLSNCAATLAAANLPYYLEYILGITTDSSSIVFVLFLTAILSVPFWVYLARRFGKAETYRLAMLGYIAVFCFMPFFTASLGNGIYPVSMLIGFFHAAALTIPWAIVPDVVEYDELQTGERREGLFYGGTTFSYKAATGIAFLISTLLLEFSGYTANQAQTPSALAAIRILIGPAPAIFLICAAALALRYPLTASKHKEILSALAEKKAAR